MDCFTHLWTDSLLTPATGQQGSRPAGTVCQRGQKDKQTCRRMRVGSANDLPLSEPTSTSRRGVPLDRNLHTCLCALLHLYLCTHTHTHTHTLAFSPAEKLSVSHWRISAQLIHTLSIPRGSLTRTNTAVMPTLRMHLHTLFRTHADMIVKPTPEI